jgi:phospholipid/cholesterol/gamma-HCH transport system substrate-binding protein
MKSQLRLGIFIAFTLAVAAAAIFLIGSKRLLFTSTYRLYADFANGAGLQSGAPVQVAGLQEGTVAHVFLPPRSGLPIRVEMRLRGATRGIIKLDSAATIATQGLVGEQYIEISMGSPQSPSVRNGDTIQGKTPPQISDLITHAETVLDRMNGAIGNITDITGKLDRGEGSLGALLNNPSLYNHFNQVGGNLAGITDKLNRGEGSLGALLNNPSAYRHIDQAAGNLAEITGKLNNGHGSLGALVNNPSLYHHFDQAAGNLAEITGKLNSGQGSLGAMLNDRSLYEHVSSAAGNLDALAGKLNNSQGTLGQLINNPSMYTNLNRTAENFQDDSEALKHNFLLRGFFKHRGYFDDSDLGRYAIAALPPGPPAQRFDLPGARVFKKNEAQVEDGKALDQAGKYLESHPFWLAVVTAKAGMEGDSDADRKLTAARAYAARLWLVNHFSLEDTRIKTLAMGKTPAVPASGEVSILVYSDGGPAETNAADRAEPSATTSPVPASHSQ